MHCCWTLYFIRLVITVLVCTSVVSTAPIPVRPNEAHPPSPTVPRLTSRANILARIIARGLTETMTGIVLPRASNDSNTLSQLFPVPSSGPKWTTLDGESNALPLSDATLRPHNVAEGVKHTYVTYDGKSCLKSHYPAGSWHPTGNPRGGISFYAPGPANVNLETAEEAIFSYSVLFPDGFNFVKGGKLPGLCTCNLGSCYFCGVVNLFYHCRWGRR
jgi:hypothetical protein